MRLPPTREHARPSNYLLLLIFLQSYSEVSEVSWGCWGELGKSVGGDGGSCQLGKLGELGRSIGGVGEELGQMDIFSDEFEKG